MIDQAQAMPYLVEACPTFQGAWKRHLVEWGDDLPYTAAGELAHHLLERYRAGDPSCFPRLALAIERLMDDGSPWVQEFAVIGVLEAVQNVWLDGDANPDIFGMHLGPVSLSHWDQLKDFWSGREIPASGTTPDASE